MSIQHPWDELEVGQVYLYRKTWWAKEYSTEAIVKSIDGRKFIQFKEQLCSRFLEEFDIDDEFIASEEKIIYSLEEEITDFGHWLFSEEAQSGQHDVCKIRQKFLSFPSLTNLSNFDRI